MKKIGITSSMGSGKSYICELFNKLGVPVFIMDIESKKLQFENEDLKDLLIKNFPTAFNGREMNKLIMKELLFFDDSRENVKKMSDLIMPFLINVLNKFYEDNKDKKFVLVESALIYEYDIRYLFDDIIYVVSDKRKRKEMALKRDGISSEEYDKRMMYQVSDEFKKLNSTFLITNDYTDNIKKEVSSLYEKIIIMIEKGNM